MIKATQHKGKGQNPLPRHFGNPRKTCYSCNTKKELLINKINMRTDFNGKSFDFMMMTYWTKYGVGTTFHFRENLKEGDYWIGEPFGENNFWVKNLKDEFQNVNSNAKIHQENN